MNICALTLLPLLVTLPGADAPSSNVITVDPVLITLIEQVEVPAQEAGVLAEVRVREGDLVRVDQLLARIDDRDAHLAVSRAKMEHAIALKQAENDVKVRLFGKARQVGQAELKRALESKESYAKSVSQTLIDRLRLTVDQSELEIEQARHERETALLTRKLKESELALAQRSVERRRIVSPLEGVVVEIKRRRGEWVEPGQTVLRILRINRLRAQGLVDPRKVRGDLTGRPVSLSVTLPGNAQTQFTGKVVFVNPELNEVNGQITVWAEIGNKGLLLRPGLSATMTIETAK